MNSYDLLTRTRMLSVFRPIDNIGVRVYQQKVMAFLMFIDF